MSEILSQAEIDALLHALTSGEVQAETIKDEAIAKVKKYDFRRPNKFSKEQLRTLYMIHENYGRLVANFLSAYLRSSIQVKIVSVEQMTYEDFVLSLPTPTLMNVFSMEPLKGSAILQANMNFVFPIVDLLFGGRGEMLAFSRELTEIELHVLRRLNNRILEQLTYSWSDIYSFKPKLEAMETNPQFTQVISPNETVAVITLSTIVGRQEGLLNLCLPYMLLEPLISRLSASHWLAASAEGEASPDRRVAIEKILAGVPVELIAYCGRTRLPVRDFIQLQVGDVITLEKVVGEDLELYVDGHLKFKVQPGVVGQKMAIQVTEVV
ncbi:flagellar motor switch protein FliM [Moorella sulfitireducens (nom. illeg.)]|uniref:flagellar motor switch protein FliM n=1 Tax=Neomoorella sulfitireducens TaxID=2972948 RepID=UPI0021AD148A|nr:flagellar motor switch protein FliM [Moorella sulfitireducens]